MKYIIGIDADGTIFDTMNLKHKEIFWQCMIKKWQLHDIAAFVIKTAEKINLYSQSRGINRFPGLLKVMEACPHLDRLDKMPLYNFINSGYPLSNDGLAQYINNCAPSPLLSDVLSWSREIDLVFAEKTKNMLPFNGADEAIRNISKTVDVVIVSSASRAILERDLSFCGLNKYIKEIKGQENGKKEQQLLSAISDFAPDRVLMIGDAPSDFEAANKAGAYFYPILPGSEENSWQLFNKKYFDSFVNDSYHSSFEKTLYKQFLHTFNL